MRKRLSFVLVIVFAAITFGVAGSEADFVEELLSRMTVEEKIGQTVQLGSGIQTDPKASDSTRERAREEFLAEIRAGKVGALLGNCGIEKFNLYQRAACESRLGIPLMVGADMIHGGMTTFPVPLAFSCSWDADLWRRGGELIARESPLLGCNWTFTPMLDIARDQRWGRISEGAGQDPYLASIYADAMVRGIQRDPDPGCRRLAACLKHFVGYGAAVGGRDYAEVEIAETTLNDVYLPPFAAGVRAGAMTVMPGFHTVNGEPCSVSRWLLTDVLRGQLGFDGFCVSDNGAIHESGPIGHNSAADMAGVSALSLKAGMAMDMVRRSGRAFPEGLPEAYRRGLVSEDDLDAQVRGILAVKHRLGLFTDPYIDAAAQSNAFRKSDHLAFAREAAAKSAVLVKNEKAVLPLAAGRKVALIGAFGGDPDEMFDPWSHLDGVWRENTSLLEGLRADGVDVTFTKGFEICQDVIDEESIRRACAEADVVIGCFGEHHRDNGEDCSLSRLELPRRQLRAVELIAESGKPFAAVLFGARPRAVPEIAEKAGAVLVAWCLGACGGWGAADVLTGRCEPYGRLTCDFPRESGQCPMYYNHLPGGRPYERGKRYVVRYIDSVNEPLFPFGLGLSYTTFAYSDQAVRVEGGEAVVSCKLTNTGRRQGSEVVQAYLRTLFDPVHSHPVRELKGFRRVALQPGKSAIVEIRVPVKSGTYDAFICADSISGSALRFEVK